MTLVKATLAAAVPTDVLGQPPRQQQRSFVTACHSALPWDRTDSALAFYLFNSVSFCHCLSLSSHVNSKYLTQSGRIPFDKPHVLQLVKKLPTFYRTECSPPCSSTNLPILSYINPVHTLPSNFCKIHFHINSHLCLGLPSGPFPSRFSTKILYISIFPPYMPHASRIWS